MFTNCSENASSYVWDFGDGNESSEKNPTHVYELGGTYTITLVATGNNVNTIKKEIIIGDKSVACFTLSPNENLVSGQQVHFENCSENASAYFWDFGDGNTSSDENTSNVYEDAGTYTVSLTAYGLDTSVVINEIIIAEKTIACFKYSDTLSIYTNTLVEFENCSENATGFEWTFDSFGTSSDENPGFTFPEAGTFEVTLVALGVVNDTISQQITVDEIPNYFMIGDEVYTLKTGIVENYGLFGNEVYNFDISLVTEGIQIETTDGELEASGKGDVIYFELMTGDEFELQEGEYTYSQEEPMPFTFTYAEYLLGVDTDLGEIDYDEEMTGTFTLSKQGENYMVTFDCVSVSGKKVTGHFSGEFISFDYSDEMNKENRKKQMIN